MRKSKARPIISTILIFSCFIIWTCSDTSDPEPDPPAIPPQTTFILDLSSLTGNSIPGALPSELSDHQAEMAGTNWIYAAGTVGFWTGVVNITLAVPTAAFAATINQEPIYLGDLRWKWTKTFQIMFDFYTAELYGKMIDNKVDWEMYISKTGGFTNFLWYTGESNLDGSGGTWTLNKSDTVPVEFLFMAWHYVETGVGDLLYEIIESGAEYEDSYIFYSFNNDSTYNSVCTLFNSVNEVMVNVEWHRINKYGRVISPFFYNDNLWHCWDENLNDSECE